VWEVVFVSEGVSRTPHARNINKMRNPARKCDISCGSFKKLSYNWVEEGGAVVEIV
jgi:hypothetical protein